MKRLSKKTIKGKDDGVVGIARKFWVPLAEAQLKRRREAHGDEANTCEGCREILMCSGPVSFQICQTVDEMMATGIVSGPKKIPFRHMRAKVLPIDKEYLQQIKRDIKRTQALKKNDKEAEA